MTRKECLQIAGAVVLSALMITVAVKFGNRSKPKTQETTIEIQQTK